MNEGVARDVFSRCRQGCYTSKAPEKFLEQLQDPETYYLVDENRYMECRAATIIVGSSWRDAGGDIDLDLLLASLEVLFSGTCCAMHT